MIRERLVLSCEACGFALIQGLRSALAVYDEAGMEKLALECGWTTVVPNAEGSEARHYCGACVKKRGKR